MHLAPGITIREKSTGRHVKIDTITATAMHYSFDGKHEGGCLLDNVPEHFEEFNTGLARCPFCGSTHIGEAGRAGCGDCHATAPTAAAWNTRVSIAPTPGQTVLPL